MNGLAIAADAHIPIAVLAALALLLLVVGSWLGRWPLWVAGWVVALAAIGIAFFFRDPPRPGERGEALYVAPADGRVLAVDEVDEPRYLDGPARRVSIFLSLLDVHVQRSPVDGVVEFVEHRSGRFAAAWSDAAASENESTLIGIRAGDERVVVRQVAGLVARRIVTYVEEGERVDQGQRIGLIRFGSRVDAYLPADAVVDVRPGDRVRAGLTILGRRPSGEPVEREAGRFRDAVPERAPATAGESLP